MLAQTGKKSHQCDFEKYKLSHECDVLSEVQQRAVELLLQGRTQEEVAEEIGVSRESINRWLNRNPDFVAALNERWEQLQIEANEAISSLRDAIEVIEKALGDTCCREKIEVELAFNKIKTFFSYNGCKELMLIVKAKSSPVVLELPKRRSRTSFARPPAS